MHTLTIDFDAVHCDWRHLKSTGRGWVARFRELGGSDQECAMLLERLRKGMAAEIELARIYKLAGELCGNPSEG